MAAGLFGYLGYDMVRQMERLPTDKPPGLGLPDGIFLRPTVMAIFDNIEDRVTVVTPAWPDPELSARAAYDVAAARLAATVADFGRPLPPPGSVGEAPSSVPEPRSNVAPDAFHAMVERAKRYILAGDIFQVVLSQRFAVPFPLPPFALYRALRRLNPSPFLFFLDFGGFAVVGSSPEILVRLRDGTVTIRPIAGTRPRGRTPAEDKALAAELLADPKELAEHLMLLDLGRNDVGRVARTGTVRVTEQMQIEHYSHVMHIVSNVEGEIDPAYDAMDALIAGFPAGTVSGAPKVRAMEIIDELEPERRGVYAGAIGYVAAGGAMDSCIALRTAVVKDGTMYVQAGGGIVADSDPEAEFQESCNKARALLRAAEEAVRFAATGQR
jgi:anthranilate synthase component 1